MLSIPIITYWVPELRNVALVHLLVYPEHRGCHRSCSVSYSSDHLRQSLSSNAYYCFRDDSNVRPRV